MSEALPQPRRLEPVSMLGALMQSLTRLGWRETTPRDDYLTASGQQWFEPAMPPRSGHTPARLTTAGDALMLATYDREGAATEQVAWSWVDPGNLMRVHDYVTLALAEAMEARS